MVKRRSSFILFFLGLPICAALVSHGDEAENSALLRSSTSWSEEDESYNRSGELLMDLEELGQDTPLLVLAKGAFARHKRKPVMWIHVHKNAGGTMCKAARQQEEVVTPEDGNCNSRDLHDCFFPDGLMSKPQWTTCAERAEYFKRNHFTWGQIEREVSLGDYCPEHFINAITLRDPIERTESYINWNTKKVSGDKHHEWASCIETKTESTCPISARMNNNRLAKLNFGYIEWDNFQVRTLGGYDTMRLPPGALNRTHLDAAISLLDKFDLVIPVEMLGQRAVSDDMDRVLGWHVETHQKRDHKSRHNINLKKSERKRWERVNWLDVALYKHFSSKYQESFAQVAQAPSRSQPSQQSTLEPTKTHKRRRRPLKRIWNGVKRLR